MIREDGGPEVLRYEDVPDPEPGPGEVLVRMRVRLAEPPRRLDAEGPPFGAETADPRRGRLRRRRGARRRRRGPRAAASAVVINPGIEHGDAIHVIGEHTQGVHAELAAIPATNVYPLRDGVSFEEAAAFPLVFETAYRMLVTRAHLQRGRVGARLGHRRRRRDRRRSGSRRRSARRTIVTSSSDEKLAKAAALGADVDGQPRDRRRRRGRQGSDRERRRRRRRDGRRGDLEALARRGPRRRPGGRLRRHLRPEPAGRAAPALVEAARHARLDDGHARGLRGRLRPGRGRARSR